MNLTSHAKIQKYRNTRCQHTSDNSKLKRNKLSFIEQGVAVQAAAIPNINAIRITTVNSSTLFFPSVPETIQIAI